jgi:hypothetical protein
MEELQLPRHLSTASLALPMIGYAIICWPAPASAQTAKDLVGTWEFVSIVNTAKDGTKTEPFGSNLKGLFIMGPDGRFAQIVTRAAIPKFASDNRLQGTPEENKAIVQGSIGYFGTYSVDNKVLVLHVEGGTWPSWTGTDQKRLITSYTADRLTWTLEASVGGSNVSTVKRVK